MTSGRPKLLLFSHICSPVHFTGAEKLLLSFAKEMRRLFDCALVVPNEGAIAGEARGSGIEVRILDIPLSVAMYVAMPHLGAELHELRASPAWESLIALLQAERPDYVWVNTCVHPLPALAAKALGIPVIWALMETINPGPNRDEAVGVIDAHSDRIVGISRAVLSPFPQEIVSAKATVLSPFLERADLLPDSWPYNRQIQRRSNGWGEHHLVVGYIASTIYQNKGLREFLQAVLPLAAHDTRVRMLIVGHPTEAVYVEDCREAIRKAGLADRAAWISFTPRIEQVYPAMDIVVVPSLVAEGFGMAALEGMIFGKPVVSFASGGLAEIHEATGNADYLAEPGNVAGLAGAVAALLKNDALRGEVGRRNAKVASERFGAEAFRRALESFVSALPSAAVPLPLLARGSGSEIYLIENGRRRPFASVDALLGMGYRLQDVAVLPDDRLSLVPIGAPISLPEAEPRRRAAQSVSARRRRPRRRARRSRHSARRIRRAKGVRRVRRAKGVRRVRRVRGARKAKRARRAGSARRTRRAAARTKRYRR